MVWPSVSPLSWESWWAFPAALAVTGPIRGSAPDRYAKNNVERQPNMPLYEHVFLTRQDVSNAQVETLTKEFCDIIDQGGGKVDRTEYWGVKPLAYKIKKSRKAHFTMLNIDAPHEAVAEMERRMGLSTDVLRFLTIKVEALEKEPSVMMRKQDRDDRGGRGGPRGGRSGGRDGHHRGRRDGEDRPPRPSPDAARSSSDTASKSETE